MHILSSSFRFSFLPFLLFHPLFFHTQIRAGGSNSCSAVRSDPQKEKRSEITAPSSLPVPGNASKTVNLQQRAGVYAAVLFPSSYNAFQHMLKLLRNLLFISAAAAVAALVWNAAATDYPARPEDGRSAPPEVDLDELSDRERELLIRELTAQF